MKIENKKITVKRFLIGIPIVLVALFLFMMGFGLWTASDQLLSPSFRGVTKDLSFCPLEVAAFSDKHCGNLRLSKQFIFSEVKIPSNNYELPGWLIKTSENGKGEARGAVMLVHAGGIDRRDETKYIQFFLDQQLDVLTFDYSCHGEAPCPVKGLSYGDRESQDVIGAYNYLRNNYDKVYAMGQSVGASAILIALPNMPNLSGVVVEAPMAKFERLIKEAPEAQSAPSFFVDAMINLAMFRGQFDAKPSPEDSVRLTRSVPILFVHSREDKIVSFKHTADLYAAYAGEKGLWTADMGEHASIWNAEREEYKNVLTNFLNNTK